MPRPVHILAVLLVVTLALAPAGCIEQKDPPEHGEFTITLESAVVHWAPVAGGELHGAHADAETELHHQEPEYSWDVHGVGDLEGSKVALPAGEAGLVEATYHLEFYGMVENLSMVVARFPSANETYVALAIIPGEGGEAPPPEVVHIEPGSDLEVLEQAEVGHLYQLHQDGAGVAVINISLNHTAEHPATYVVAVRRGPETIPISFVMLWEEALVIHPGLRHHLVIDPAGDLHVDVANDTMPNEPFHSSDYEGLPGSYKAHPGTLEWHGDVGEGEEAPGPSAAFSALAIAIAVVVMALSRRRG